jgi:signal peptidase II
MNAISLLLRRENVYSCIIILIIFLLDRFSKIEIISNYSQNTFFINNFLNLELIWNTGIGFGLLSYESNAAYNLISLLIGGVIVTLTYITLTAEKSDKIIYSIIIGGALGNFYDRLVYKAVPDFIDMHYNNIHWFTFNIADIFITIGVIIFFIKFNKSK